MIHLENPNTQLVPSQAPTIPSPVTRPDALPGALAEFPREEVLAELDRIVGSADFRASERNRRVLQYLVRCSLDGREGEISAYNIATRVYGRPASFNPYKDPIVRIEMARLRRDLELYYLKSGVRNPLRISVPKGRYLPKVLRAAPHHEARSPVDAAPSPFLVSVLRASLLAWSGAPHAAAAWQDLLLTDPHQLADWPAVVARQVGDEEVAGLIIEGVRRAAQSAT